MESRFNDFERYTNDRSFDDPNFQSKRIFHEQNPDLTISFERYTIDLSTIQISNRKNRSKSKRNEWNRDLTISFERYTVDLSMEKPNAPTFLFAGQIFAGSLQSKRRNLANTRDRFFEGGFPPRDSSIIYARNQRAGKASPPSFSPPRRFVKFSLDRARTPQCAICHCLYKYGLWDGDSFCSLKDNERFYRSMYARVGFPVITRFTYFFSFSRM